MNCCVHNGELNIWFFLSHYRLDDLLLKGNSQKLARFYNEQKSDHFPDSFALSPARKILVAHSVSFLTSFPSHQPMIESHGTHKNERCAFPWEGHLLLFLVPWGDTLFWIATLKNDFALLYATGSSHAFQVFMAR